MGIMGRPKKDFSIEEFEKLCSLQCTKEEIAAWFDFSEDTLENRMKEHYDSTFSVVFAQKKGLGRISLRRKQWKIADKSAAMAIFLGKNHLGQSDKQEIEMQQTVNKVFDISKMSKEEYKEFIKEQLKQDSE